MKNICLVFGVFILTAVCTACSRSVVQIDQSQTTFVTYESSSVTSESDASFIEETTTVESETTSEERDMVLTIDGTQVNVEWENNDSVEALRSIISDGPITIQMSMYGGFEQVGSIGQRITSDDRQVTTSSGDIVLYSSDQIVIFYGSNSWSYTRLGKINLSEEELTDLLSNGGVTITIS